MIKQHVKLSEADRQQLQHLIAQEKVSIKVFRRAKALLLLDQGQSLQQAAATVSMDYNAVAKWRNRYMSEGLAVLEDKPRSGRPVRIEGLQRAKITALACSPAPAGHARWSLRLLADKAVELGYVEAISYKHVGTILKKTNYNRISRRRGALEN
jgi:transposase